MSSTKTAQMDLDVFLKAAQCDIIQKYLQSTSDLMIRPVEQYAEICATKENLVVIILFAQSLKQCLNEQ